MFYFVIQSPHKKKNKFKICTFHKNKRSKYVHFSLKNIDILLYYPACVDTKYMTLQNIVQFEDDTDMELVKNDKKYIS